MAIKKILCVAFALVLTTPVFGQAVSLADMKIGYVVMNKAINSSQEGQRSRKFLEAQAGRTQQQLAEKEREVIKADEDLRTNIMLNESAKQQRRMEIEKMKQALREEVAKAQQTLRQNEARHTQKIFDELAKVIKKIAESDGYDLVLEFNLKQAILYSKFEMTDITDKVIVEYDLQSVK